MGCLYFDMRVSFCPAPFSFLPSPQPGFDHTDCSLTCTPDSLSLSHLLPHPPPFLPPFLRQSAIKSVLSTIRAKQLSPAGESQTSEKSDSNQSSWFSTSAELRAPQQVCVLFLGHHSLRPCFPASHFAFWYRTWHGSLRELTRAALSVCNAFLPPFSLPLYVFNLYWQITSFMKLPWLFKLGSVSRYQDPIPVGWFAFATMTGPS